MDCFRRLVFFRGCFWPFVPCQVGPDVIEVVARGSGGLRVLHRDRDALCGCTRRSRRLMQSTATCSTLAHTKTSNVRLFARSTGPFTRGRFRASRVAEKLCRGKVGWESCASCPSITKLTRACDRLGHWLRAGDRPPRSNYPESPACLQVAKVVKSKLAESKAKL